MKTKIFKGILIAAIGLFAYCGTTTAQDAYNDGCTNATLHGAYAFRISGEIFVPNTSTNPPTPTTSIMAYRDGVAITHFRGDGTLSQADFVMGNGQTPAQQTPPPDPKDIDPTTGFSTGEKGTYEVYPDCTGKATINFPPPLGMDSGNQITLMFVIANGGRTLHTIVSALTLYNGHKAFPNIHSDAERLEPIEDRR
ncbi:MAG TPA: hypothetical protein VKH45_02540 [Candidatus Acidoferrum sp.]|nr:hypothetical protein [Candidatus Acidoferrum sp.]